MIFRAELMTVVKEIKTLAQPRKLYNKNIPDTIKQSKNNQVKESKKRLLILTEVIQTNLF